MSASATNDSVISHAADSHVPRLPTETEIYILPDGRIVIADLPFELTGAVADLGVTEACQVSPFAPEALLTAAEGAQ